MELQLFQTKVVATKEKSSKSSNSALCRWQVADGSWQLHRSRHSPRQSNLDHGNVQTFLLTLIVAELTQPSSLSSSFSPDSFALLLKKLVLSPSTFTTTDVRSAFVHLATVDGALPGQIGAFVTALKLTGKDALPEVVATCAEVMREYAVSIDVRATVEGEGPICDIVGTGGDGQNTFNVSTTAGIVAAGAGCRVYKVRDMTLALDECIVKTLNSLAT